MFFLKTNQKNKKQNLFKNLSKKSFFYLLSIASFLFFIFPLAFSLGDETETVGLDGMETGQEENVFESEEGAGESGDNLFGENVVEEDGQEGLDETNKEAVNEQEEELEESVEVQMEAQEGIEGEENSGGGMEENEELLEEIVGDIFISEIAWMGTIVSSSDEWLELYNRNEKEVDLEGWSLGVWESKKARDENQNKKIAISLKGKISAEGYFLLERTDDESVPEEKADQIYSGTLSNNGGYLELENKQGEIIDWADFSSGWSGGDNNQKSTLERDLDNDDWYTASIIGGTPKKKNSARQESPEQEEDEICSLSADGIYLNEWLPNPENADKDQEWVELINSGGAAVELFSWKLVKSSGKNFFLDDFVILPGAFLKVNLSGSFVLKNQNEKLTLVDCAGKIQDEASFSGAAGSGLSYNRTDQGSWQWSRWKTPEEKNRLNSPPKVVLEKIKEAYVGMKIIFDASGSSDGDREELKFAWDFGDGHKSYLEKTSHIFSSKGTYKITLKVSDGTQPVLKEFSLKVEKYPKKKVEIIRILPNPQGTDSGKELIWLKNYDKKKVNLKGWKIFSGSSQEKAVGHLIEKDFFLKENEEKPLSRQECAFSLTNQTGYVALAYPNGEKVADLEYDFDGKTVLEGARYFLSGGNVWRWEFLVATENEELGADDDLVLGSMEENLTLEESRWEDFFQDPLKKKTLSWQELEFILWQKENQPWLEFLPGIF